MFNLPKTKYFIIAAAILLSTPMFSDAQEGVVISPAVINEKAYARDVIDKEVMITNNSDSRVTLWPLTFDVDAMEGSQDIKAPSASDRSSSLSSWLEITRSAISLNPGESETLELTIRVNLSAKPGTYNARLVFASGHKRGNAESNALSAPYTLINVEVLEEVIEHMNLISFSPEKVFFSGFPVSFDYELENTGDRSQEPKGEIIIYNRRGKEVASVPVSVDGSGIAEGESVNVASSWQGPGSGNDNFLLAKISSSVGGFGRYKALLNVEYGANGQYKLQDTVFFWVVPIYALAAIFVVLLFSAIYTANILHRRQAQYVSDVVTSEPEKDFVIDMRRK